jgi:hypothetical protein
MATGTDQLHFRGNDRCLADADSFAEDIYFIISILYNINIVGVLLPAYIWPLLMANVDGSASWLVK